MMLISIYQQINGPRSTDRGPLLSRIARPHITRNAILSVLESFVVFRQRVEFADGTVN